MTSAFASTDHAFFAAIVENADDAIASKSLDGIITSWNKAAEKMFGYRADEAIGQPMTIIFPPDRLPEEAVFLEKIARGEHIDHYETIRVRKDGAPIDVSVSLSPIVDDEGRIIGAAKIVRDITDRKRAEEALRLSEERFRRLVEDCPLPMGLLGVEDRIVYLNRKFIETFGYDLKDIPTIGDWYRLAYPDEAYRAEVVSAWMSELDDAKITGPKAESRGYRVTCKNGDIKTFNILGVRIDGQILAVFEDITERRRLEQVLRDMARTDPLTGLANRRSATEALETEFLRRKRFGSDAALLMIDIDHFKQVNDTYGHEAGDAALVSLATALKSMARATDLLARYGGEEFVFLLAGTNLPGAVEMAGRIRETVSRIVAKSSSGNFGFTVSIGVASFRDDDENWACALQRADRAMFQAKALGRNRVVAADVERNSA